MRMSNAKASGRNSDWEDHKIIVITMDCSSRVAEVGHSGCGQCTLSGSAFLIACGIVDKVLHICGRNLVT